jgi:hypothetical protein
MKKISDKEKQRILELHHKTPMKPYLFEHNPTYTWATGNQPAPQNNIVQTDSYSSRVTMPSKVTTAPTNTTTNPTSSVNNTTKKQNFIGIPWNQIKINEQPPFKNNTEGDEFRLWVNTNFKDIAAHLQLSSGATTSDGYKNIYIQRAWNYPMTSTMDKDLNKSNLTFEYEQGKTLGEIYNNLIEYQNYLYKDIMRAMEQGNVDRYYTNPDGTPLDTTQERKMTPEEWAYRRRSGESSWLTILSIGALFIPWVGPLVAAGISASIGIYDAKKWQDYGDTRTASFVFTLSIIPLIGPISSKIPLVAKYGEAGMIKLGEKLGQSGIKGLTTEETYLVNEISKQLATKEGQLAIERYLISQANNALDKKFIQTMYYTDRAAQYQFFKNLVSTTTTLGTYEAARLLHNPIFDAVIGDTLYELSNEVGFKVEDLKALFQVKTKEDERLLVLALKDHKASPYGPWRPNRPVPLIYQTKEYKKNIKDITEWLDKRVPKSKDSRIYGTYGRPTSWFDNPEEYKFIGGKFYSKNKDDDDTKWVEVKDSSKIKELESMFEEKGLVKDETGYVYVK